MEIVKNLIRFATKLDEEHLTVVASAVDEIATNIIKVAQSVGPQGYWIRNKICFQNCVRQKKIANKNKATQVAWLECQDEYQNSINNDGSAWDKYAEGLPKTASKINIKIASQEEFNNLAKAAFQSHNDIYMTAATRLIRLADSLADYDENLSAEASNLASAMQKEALQWWDNVRDMGKAVRQKGQEMWANPPGQQNPGAGQGFVGRYRANQDARNQQKIDTLQQKRQQYQQKWQPGPPTTNTVAPTAPSVSNKTAPATPTPATSKPPVGNPQPQQSLSGVAKWLSNYNKPLFDKYQKLSPAAKQQLERDITKKWNLFLTDAVNNYSTTQTPVGDSGGTYMPGVTSAHNKGKTIFRLA